jgi:hypothetical protein
MSHSVSDTESFLGVAHGRSVEEALAHWVLATSEMARSDDWLTVAFERARQRRAQGCA